MKKAILAASLCAVLAFSAPFAIAQGFQPAPAEGGQSADPNSSSMLNTQHLQQQLLEQTKQQFLNMTPEERQQLLDQARQSLEAMTPEQRQQMVEEAKQRFESLSPDEQEQLKRQAQEQIGKLSPEERTKLMNNWGGQEQQQQGGEQPNGELPPEQDGQPAPQR